VGVLEILAVLQYIIVSILKLNSNLGSIILLSKRLKSCSKSPTNHQTGRASPGEQNFRQKKPGIVIVQEALKNPAVSGRV